MAVTVDPTGKAAPAGGFQTGGWYSGFQYWDGSFAPKAGMIHPSSNQQGAGQMVSAEVNAAESVRQGKAPDENQNYINQLNTQNNNNYNSGSGSDVTSFLNNYQSNLMSGLSDINSTVPTFEELKASLLPSTSLPNVLNRAETRAGLIAQYGISELETQLNSVKTEIQALTDQTKATTGAEEGKTVPMNVISGRITEEERVASIRMNDLLRQKDSIVNELTTKYNIVNTYMSDIGLDYNDAVDRYNTEFTQNLNIQSMLNGMKETAWNQAMDLTKLKISTAQANLSTLVNAITSGNMTYSNLSADTKLQIQKLEIQSGLPVGTVASMGLSASDSILGWSSDKTQAMVSDGSGGFKIISTGFTAESSGGTATERAATAKQIAINLLDTQLKNGETLRDAIIDFTGVGGLTENDIYYRYNQIGYYGYATEKPSDLARLGINNSASGGIQ